jgi:hypothetical protein
MTGKANGQELSMIRAYLVKGDLGLLIKMSQLGGSVAGGCVLVLWEMKSL